MKQLMLCFCLVFFGPSLRAQLIDDLPHVSYFLGASFSVFSYGAQFYAVQHRNAPVITLSENIRVAQRSPNALVVMDLISRETHTYILGPASNNNEHEVQGIIAFRGQDFNQMLLTSHNDAFPLELNFGFLSSLDNGDGIRALGCFCMPEQSNDGPCASGSEGASECRVNFSPDNRDNGCWTICAQKYHACCNLH